MGKALTKHERLNERSDQIEAPEGVTTGSPSLFRPAIFDALEGKSKILISGCGGGFDVFAGLPLYFALRHAEVDVFLGNLSFTALRSVKGRRPTELSMEIRHNTKHSITSNGYFPEYHLCQWLKNELQDDVVIYAFDRETGAKQLTSSYESIVKTHSIDAIILVDGGTDSLMFGDELSLGTPHEDSTSIAAVTAIKNVDTKLLVCLGFGVDSYHGVCHSHFLENTSSLITDGAFLGATSILKETKEAQLYIQAYDYVKSQMMPSIVSSSISDAIRGCFGNYHSNHRTKGSELYINPLMGMYWCYRLEGVARRMKHIDRLMETESVAEVDNVITTYRATVETKRQPVQLPM